MGQLPIEQGEPPAGQPRIQGRQRRAAGLGLQAEHALAEEGATQGHSVETAPQLAIPPRFDAVGMARAVQGQVGLPHLRRDPGAVLAGAGHLGAVPDHRLEGRVEAGLEGLVPQAPAGAGGEVQVAGPQQGPLWRGPPEQRILLTEPREDAAAIGLQEPGHREVPADGQKAVFGQLRVREDQAVRQPKDRHSRPSLRPTLALPPLARGPKRMASARGRRSSRSMSRAMGRAPKAGS